MSHRRHNKQRGVTMLELMIAITLLSAAVDRHAVCDPYRS